MSELKLAKYREGRTPPPSFYDPIDPCKNPPPCSFNLSAMMDYSKKVGKKVSDLSYDEVEQFRIKE